MMKRIIFFLLFLYSSISLASIPEVAILQSFEEQAQIVIESLPDLIDKEEKIARCIDFYILQQSKSYAKIVQNTLYDLIHNFDKITSKIYGKKQTGSDIPYEDKIEILARIQCDVYHAIGTLK